MPPPSQLQNPFVIQCKHCQLILADSFALTNYKHDNLIFSAISTPTIINARKHTNTANNNSSVNLSVDSQSVKDKDCTYQEIVCKCGITVGKKYITVTKAFADCVDMYCFDKNTIDSYKLGSIIDDNTELSLRSVTEMCEEIERLKRFCVYLYKRVDENK